MAGSAKICASAAIGGGDGVAASGGDVGSGTGADSLDGGGDTAVASSPASLFHTDSNDSDGGRATGTGFDFTHREGGSGDGGGGDGDGGDGGGGDGGCLAIAIGCDFNDGTGVTGFGFGGTTARTSGAAPAPTFSVSPARVAIMKSTSVAERSSSGVNCTSMPGGWRASPLSACTRLTVPRP